MPGEYKKQKRGRKYKTKDSVANRISFYIRLVREGSEARKLPQITMGLLAMETKKKNQCKPRNND